MKKVDFSKTKFRCSQLGNLMVNPRAKSQKLSETTKSYLLEVYIAEAYGREKEIGSKFLDKGNYAEEASLTIVTNVLDRLLVKNRFNFENDFITGTPDVVEDSEKADQVLDIKTSWDIFTFAGADGRNKMYYWQLQGYMWLTNKQSATLAYTLVDTPDFLIYNEVQKKAYHLGIVNDDAQMNELEDKLRADLTYEDIPEIERVKLFQFERNDEDIEKLKERIVDAREYLSNISRL